MNPDHLPWIFRQFHDQQSGCLSYLLGDPQQRVALLIDPLAESSWLYQGMLQDYGLKLVWILETHLHEDHATAADSLRQTTGASIAVPAGCGAAHADRQIKDGEKIACGNLLLEAIATPGHSPSCHVYRWGERLFTGDTLLIGGCGRTDTPGSNPGQLYDSIRRRLMPLPDETLIYPGHALEQRLVSCIGEERLRNPVLQGMSRDEFVASQRRTVRPLPANWQACLDMNRRCGQPEGPGAAAKVSTKTSKLMEEKQHG